MTAPTPTAQMAVILDRLARENAGQPHPTALPPAEGRAAAEKSNEHWNRELPEMARIREVSVPGEAASIPCRILEPKGAPSGTIFFVHGGGWAFCSMQTHERAARLLAIEANAIVVTCGYRLAPEHPFPAGLEDCIAVWRSLCASAPPFTDLPRPLAVSGDSAGANLALALMLVDGLPKPDFGALFYGVFGADFASPSYVECAQGPGLTRGQMQQYWDWYAPEADRDDPRIAPLAASDEALLALPPLYLNAAEIDPLRSDSERLFARLSALGRADQFRLYGGVVHGFMQMSLELEEARQSLADAGAAFRTFVDQTARKNDNWERTK